MYAAITSIPSLRELRALPFQDLTPELERTLIALAQGEIQRNNYRAPILRALLKIFDGNIKAAIMPYVSQRFPYGDLEAEAHKGFKRAIKKFNLQAQNRLWTYAKYWVLKFPRLHIEIETGKDRNKSRKRKKPKKPRPQILSLDYLNEDGESTIEPADELDLLAEVDTELSMDFLYEAIAEATADLSEKDRQIIWDRIVEDSTYSRLGQIFECDRSTVQRRFQKIMVGIREQITEILKRPLFTIEPERFFDLRKHYLKGCTQRVIARIQTPKPLQWTIPGLEILEQPLFTMEPEQFLDPRKHFLKGCAQRVIARLKTLKPLQWAIPGLESPEQITETSEVQTDAPGTATTWGIRTRIDQFLGRFKPVAHADDLAGAPNRGIRARIEQVSAWFKAQKHRLKTPNSGFYRIGVPIRNGIASFQRFPRGPCQPQTVFTDPYQQPKEFPMRFSRSRRLTRSLMLAVGGVLLTQVPALAQSCQAGLFTDLGSAIVTALQTFSLADLSAQACSMAYLAMILIAFFVIGAGVAGAIRAYNQDDITLFIKPLFLALAVALAIVAGSNIFV